MAPSSAGRNWPHPRAISPNDSLRTWTRSRANGHGTILFLGSDEGGLRAAIIYTIAETAKLNGLDPEAYIAAILDRMARGHPIGRLDELLPWKIR